MQYRTMPGADEPLSVLGLGTMRLPTKDKTGIWKPVDDNAALALVDRAVKLGVNYIDTGYIYHRGDAERFIGEKVLPKYRGQVHIATKMPCLFIRRCEQIESIWQRQLEKLGTGSIDYYLLHSLDGEMWDRMKQLGATAFLDRIRQSGQARHVGFSFHGAYADFVRIIGEYPWEFAQVQVNIVDEQFQAGAAGVKYAADKGLGVIVMEPLRGGALAANLPAAMQAVYDKADEKRSPADWGLSFVYDMPEVTLALSGLNQIAHLEENAAIADRAQAGGLTPQQRRVIEAARSAFREAQAVGCTGCGYCMPCPQGIHIPSVLKCFNDIGTQGRLAAWKHHIRFAGVQYAKRGPHWAGSCTACGKCEQRCPQQLEIIGAMRQTSRKLEGPATKTLSALLRKFVG